MEKVWLLNRVCLALLVGLYGWSMRFNLEVRVRIGTLTMQSYMVVLLFYLLAVLGIRKRGPICRDGIFELALILQIFVTVGYWLMVHRQLILSSGFSQEVIIWNIFIHILPLLCLTGTQLLEPVAFKNRLVPLAFFVFGLAFPLNYGTFTRTQYSPSMMGLFIHLLSTTPTFLTDLSWLSYVI